MRYYEEINGDTASYAYEAIGLGVVVDAAAPQGMLWYTTKRHAPTVAFKGAASDYGCIGSANQALTGLTFNNPEVDRTQWVATSGTSSTVGHACLLRLNNMAARGITITSEL